MKSIAGWFSCFFRNRHAGAGVTGLFVISADHLCFSQESCINDRLRNQVIERKYVSYFLSPNLLSANTHFLGT